MKISKIILIAIIALAFVTRFYQLDSLPALNADEASNAYDAWSLIQTGEDQHGNPWPIHFQSFNDYKPGLYVYFDIPFIYAFGLTPLAARLPGVLAGVFSVWLIYLLALEINKLRGKEKDYLFPLTSALFLSISPWHIHFSRGGWEVNLATMFLILGVWAFLKALQKPKYFMIWAISFALSLYAYQATRIIAPLLALTMVFMFGKKIKASAKPVVIAIAIGLIIITPLLLDFTNGNVLSRAAGVGLFADSGPLSRINEQRGEHSDYHNLLAKVYHNKPVNYGLAFLENWASHFHGEFLFLSGDEIQRNRIPETGQMYLFDIIFIVIGLVYLIKQPKGFGIIFVWLLIAPMASALTFQSPHALRAQNMVIPLILISSFGFATLIEQTGKIRYKNFKSLLYVIYCILVFWGFARYELMYWKHLDKEYPFSSQYGVAELAEFLEPIRDNYQKIIITDRYDQPYILMLFYLQIPPKDFQFNHNLTDRDGFGFSTVRSFGNFELTSIDFEAKKTQNPNSLIIGTDKEIPNEANIIKNIYGENGFLYFQIVEN